ncbi:MAG TPA: phenylacetic acid degradation protein PaaN [Mycobacteriales bacterium]|nr:phenylacetic acid degradation protein PaaN [Mycobacteriales bacterium]
MSTSTSTDFAERHAATLDQALAALRDRGYWSPYPESPRAYGEDADPTGRAAFDSYLGADLPLEQPGCAGRVATEISPYGVQLGVRYPHLSDVDGLLAAAQAGIPAWRDAGPRHRAGVCLEILDRVNKRSVEIGYAVMFTTGQAQAMAFQAGGPHAQDRGLEAVAVAYAEMTRLPAEATWEKPQGKRPPLRMTKRYVVAPRGVALVIGCNTFPTWNGYPGLFASLVTGNAAVVKPHPRAVLPLAITVGIARDVLAEAGHDPHLVTLAAEGTDEGLARTLALRPEVAIIDYTGSTEFGDWLEANATQAQVYTEKAGVNTVVVDSTDDYQGMLANLAFSLSLYSGQMCTTPQNILLPEGGIQTDAGPKSADELGADLAAAVDGLLGDTGRAVAILGAIVNDGVLRRLDAARGAGKVVLDSRPVTHPQYPDAVVRTPLVSTVDSSDEATYQAECFGPVSFLVRTPDTAAALELWRRTVRQRGALTASVYSTDEEVLAAAERVAVEAGVALSENLTGSVYVNQTAAFSDLHGTGANPAANATYCDAAFVANRFRVIQTRRHLT